MDAPVVIKIVDVCPDVVFRVRMIGVTIASNLYRPLST
jgi:hypothetical protein